MNERKSSEETRARKMKKQMAKKKALTPISVTSHDYNNFPQLFYSELSLDTTNIIDTSTSSTSHFDTWD